MMNIVLDETNKDIFSPTLRVFNEMGNCADFDPATITDFQYQRTKRGTPKKNIVLPVPIAIYLSIKALRDMCRDLTHVSDMSVTDIITRALDKWADTHFQNNLYEI